MKKVMKKAAIEPKFNVGTLVNWREDLAIYASRIIGIVRDDDDKFIGYQVEPPSYWDWLTPERRREGNYVSADDVVAVGNPAALRAAVEDWCDRLRSSRLAALTEQEDRPGFSDADPVETEGVQ